MKAFLENIAHWFQSVGVHPVLGAFIAGVAIAFVFAYRWSSPAAESGAGGLAAPCGASASIAEAGHPS